MAHANTFTRPAQGVSPHDEGFTLWAKTRLLEANLTVTELARTMGLARNTVSIAINHPTMLPRIKQRIRNFFA